MLCDGQIGLLVTATLSAAADQVKQLPRWLEERDSACLADTWVALSCPVTVGVPPGDCERLARLVSCQGPCWATALDLQARSHVRPSVPPAPRAKRGPARHNAALPARTRSSTGGTAVTLEPDATVSLMKFCLCTRKKLA